MTMKTCLQESAGSTFHALGKISRFSAEYPSFRQIRANASCAPPNMSARLTPFVRIAFFPATGSFSMTTSSDMTTRNENGTNKKRGSNTNGMTSAHTTKPPQDGTPFAL
jgi:hypothetical protein